MKITKEQFISCMEAIKNQHDKDVENSGHLERVYAAFKANLMYDNSILVKTLIGLLEALTKDNEKTIDYFICELEWGKKGGDYAIKDTVRGKVWNLHTIGDLYEYLKFYY